MKGINEIRLNPESMIEAMNEWWKRSTYSELHKQKVTRVWFNDATDEFVIQLDDGEDER